MKKLVYLFTVLFTLSVLMASPAKAQKLPCNGNDPFNPCSTPGTCNNLPINNGAIFLLIGGLVLGIVAVNRHKAAATKA